MSNPRQMIQKIIRVPGWGPLMLLAALVLSGCSPTPRVWACATTEDPPIVVAEQTCPVDREAVSAGVRWYSAPQSDVGPDDVPVVGQPLDGDFYDLRDQLDLDEKAKKTTAKKTTTRKSRSS